LPQDALVIGHQPLVNQRLMPFLRPGVLAEHGTRSASG